MPRQSLCIYMRLPWTLVLDCWPLLPEVEFSNRRVWAQWLISDLWDIKKGNQVLWQESPTNRKWVLPDSSWEFWSSLLNLTGAQDLYFLFSPLSFWVKPVLLRGYVDWWGKYSPRFSSGASQVSTSSGSIICIWCERPLCLFLEAKIHQGAGTKWQMGVKSPRGASWCLNIIIPPL